MALEKSQFILITGKRGQLARRLQETLHLQGLPFVTLGQDEMDVTRPTEVKKMLLKWRPSVVIHTAAMTDVDRGENDFQRMIEVNVHGTRNVLEWAGALSCSVMYVSSDFVFNGKGNIPYEITDRPSPINQYGYSKWLGEEYVRRYAGPWWIVRTSSIFGGGGGFVDFIAQKALNKEKIKVVDDQISSPTFADDLAKTMVLLLEQAQGIYHITNWGECSKYELATFIYETLGNSVENVTAITSEQWNSPAKRPYYSVLKPSLFKGREIPPHWKNAVEAYLEREGYL